MIQSNDGVLEVSLMMTVMLTEMTTTLVMVTQMNPFCFF